MRDPHTITFARQPDVLTLAAATWLACGAVLLGLTPLPLHDAMLGWSPAFWLLAAPSLLLLATRLRVPPAVDSSWGRRANSHRRPQRAPAARSRHPCKPSTRAIAVGNDTDAGRSSTRGLMRAATRSLPRRGAQATAALMH